jgi:ATP-binding cassette, subfamily B, bacterial
MSWRQDKPTDRRSYEKILDSRLNLGEAELTSARSDLSADGSFGDRWIVLTSERLIIRPSRGDETGSELPLADVVSARAKTAVGGGELEIRCKTSAPLRLLYTASTAHEFVAFATAIHNAINGHRVKTPPVDKVRCERCGRLLPDKNGICPACLSKWRTLRRIAKYMAPHRRQVATLASASTLISGAALLPPVITGWIIDRVLLPTRETALNHRYFLLAAFVLVLFSLRLASWGAEWIHGRTVATVGAKITADIRSQLYHHLERLSLRAFSKWDVGSLIARVTRDANSLQDFLIRGLPYTVVNGLTFGGILILLFWIDWRLAFCILLTVPVVLFWAFFFWRRMTSFYHVWWQAGARFSSHVSDTLAGSRIIKIFRQESAEIRRFGTENERLFQASATTGQKRAGLLAAMGLVTTAGMTILWLYGSVEVQRGRLTTGMLVAMYGYILLFFGPLQWLGQVSNWMTQAFTAAENIFEILDTPAETVEECIQPPISVDGRVTFRNVHFGYETAHPVLKGIDLDVRPGEFVGIVGRSGVGKTTLMHLLCRFYEPDEGVIQLDGRSIRDIPFRDLRRNIGLVLQDPFLFSGTIAENIRYGKPEANLEEIISAAKTACAHEFILQKPDGYDSRIGEGGKGLSQGEKQRIALARCLIGKPRIVILDEATSSVDPISERSIQHATNLIRNNRTTFAIAHRLSTLRKAQRIVVLEEGRIVEEGSYEELVARGGTFSSLVRLQHQTAETISIED